MNGALGQESPYMKDRNAITNGHGTLRTLLAGVLVGIPIGCLGALAIVGAVLHKEPLVSSMKFGDIMTTVTTPRDSNEHSGGDELVMTKAGRPFLLVTADARGAVSCLSLSDGPNVILTLSASPVEGRWTRAIYGDSRKQSEQYFDIDFDGRFDLKEIGSADGRTSSRYIYFAGVWRLVDQAEAGTVVSGSDTFRFKRGVGWQLQDVRNAKGQGEK